MCVCVCVCVHARARVRACVLFCSFLITASSSLKPGGFGHVGFVNNKLRLSLKLRDIACLI